MLSYLVKKVVTITATVHCIEMASLQHKKIEQHSVSLGKTDCIMSFRA